MNRIPNRCIHVSGMRHIRYVKYTRDRSTFSSSKSSAVVYGLGHHRSRSRGKCIVNSVNRDTASLLLISPEIGYFSCTATGLPEYECYAP